jgi:hypothetical protein
VDEKMTKNCVKGKSCGATCIARDERCLVELGPEASSATTKVAQLVQKVKKEGTYTPREAKGPTGATADLDIDSTARLFQPQSFDARIADIKKRDWMSPEQIEKNVKALETQKQQAQQNKKFLAELEKNLPRGTRVEVYDGNIVMSSRTKNGVTVETEFSPKGGFNFTVNGTMNAGTVKERSAKFEVASTVRNQWDALVRSLPTGHIVETSAYTEDGKARGREKAYQRVGFSKPTREGGKMFAVKQADGTMAPGTAGLDGTDQWMNQRNNPDGMWFTESKGTSEQDWYEIIFGKK